MFGQLDAIKGLLGMGPETWETRLKRFISLTSPKGTLFTAAWTDDVRARGKRLATFSIKGLDGEICKDMGADSDKFNNMTIYFSGPDNDLIAEAFWHKLTEPGLWVVDHPVHGLIDLQIVSWEQVTNPTSAGNTTAFNLSWVKSLDENLVLAAPELLNDAEHYAAKLDESAYSQFGKTSKFDKFQKVMSSINVFKGAVQKTVELSNKIMTQTPELMKAQADSMRAFNASLLPEVPDIGAIAEATRYVIMAPLQSAVDAYDKMSVFKNMVESTKDLVKAKEEMEQLPLCIRSTLKESVAAQEFVVTQQLAGMALAGLRGKPMRSRLEAALAAAELQDTFIAAVSDVQEKAEYLREPHEVSPFEDSFDDLRMVFANAIRYHQVSSFQLQIEKIITLDRPRAVVELVMEQYPDMNNLPANIDKFVAHNHLEGSEVLYLEAGRKVKVYYNGAKA